MNIANTKALCASLVKAQKGFSPALKSSANPHFKSRYAALDAVVEAVMDSLNANGIFLAQEVQDSDHGVCVQTTLIHEGGESLSFGWLTVPVSKNDAQGFGSALTYARRYSLMTALGVAPEDDDGNAAAAAPPKKAAINQAMLQEYRAAAMKGMAALQEYHKSVPACGEKTALWASESEALKSAANLADKETANA
jgi:hypothetical protein